MSAEAVLAVEDLVIEVARAGSRVVDGVSINVTPGEVLALAGESGCGKTTLSLALLGYTRRGLRVRSGRVIVDGRSLFDLDEHAREHARGSLVTYVPQDPCSALNPALRVGTQLEEVVAFHGTAEGDGRAERVADTLENVRLPATRRLLRSYPHQLSGGQQQRIAIAMAIINRPRLIVMDEPTTGLDVTTQAHVLDTIREIVGLHGGGIVYVTHDLAVASMLAVRVAVMYAGRLAEVGRADAVLGSPCHPYVHGLVQAVPDIDGRHRPIGIRGQAPEPTRHRDECLFAPRCPLAIADCTEAAPAAVQLERSHTVWCIRAGELATSAAPEPGDMQHRARGTAPLLTVSGLDAGYGSRRVLHDISFTVECGASLALVGQSGSGKTTLARCIAGLHSDFSGEILLEGQPLARSARERTQPVREAVQYVFQNPYSSLNPRRTIEQSIAQPLHYASSHPGRDEIRRRVDQALSSVLLPASVKRRFPHELSGGQRQRVAIARALIVEPKLLVCDEVTSSLDVSVQAVIIELLDQLRRDRQLSMLFVTHNLALVNSVADEIAVILDGRVVEYGSVSKVLEAPEAEETQTLVGNVPRFLTARVE